MFDRLLNTPQEAVDRRCSIEQLFLKISQNAQGNTCDRAFFLKKTKTANIFPCILLKFIKHFGRLLMTLKWNLSQEHSFNLFNSFCGNKVSIISVILFELFPQLKPFLPHVLLLFSGWNEREHWKEMKSERVYCSIMRFSLKNI